MRRLIYTIMASLDGFVEGPEGGLDWAIIDEELHTFVNDHERMIGAFLYGRRTYELMAKFLADGGYRPRKPGLHCRFCAHLEENAQDRLLTNAGLGRRKRQAGQRGQRRFNRPPEGAAR